MNTFFIICDRFGMALEEYDADGASWTHFLNDAKRFKTNSSAKRFVLKMRKGSGWPYHIKQIF